MALTLIVIICGMAATMTAFVWSWWRDVGPEPVDPASPGPATHRMLDRYPSLCRFLQVRLDRRSAGGFLLTASFAILFVVAVILGFLLDSIRHHWWAAAADASVARWGSEHERTSAVTVLRWITQLGSTYTVIGVLAVSALADFFRRRSSEVFCFVVAVGAGQLILSNVLKVVVGRARPDVLHLVAVHGHSFPSGHATAATAAGAAAALVLGRDRGRTTRAVLAGAAALVAVSVAASRALLGVHWVTDVLAGLALGWGWFSVVAVIYGGRAQRLGEPAIRPYAT